MRFRKRRFTRQTAAGPPRDARQVAFAVLSKYKHRGRFVSMLLEESSTGATSLSPDERRLAVELTNGIVRRQSTLDALLAPHVQRPRHHIEGALWTLLQLGAYQLVFLDSVPAYAAINETVRLAKTFGRSRWDAFVNGVLRTLQRTLTDEFVVEPAADAVPVSEKRYRRLRAGVFDEPSSDPAGYVAAAFSFPRWLIERWIGRFDLPELCRLGFWFDRPAPVCLRVNPLKSNRDEACRLLADAGIPAAAGTLPESIRLEGTARINSLPGFAEGLVSVQDESAMQAVNLLAPQPGETILDLCAAPGVKTTQIAERMQNSGLVVATDVRTERMARIDENCRRLGISIVRSSMIGRTDECPAGPFDAILVDVPCSNTGVLGKRPEARWRISAADITELAEQQQTLLAAACRRAGPKGRIVYSTCSIEPEENEQVVRAVLETQRDFALVLQRNDLPGRSADGGYQALLQRRS